MSVQVAKLEKLTKDNYASWKYKVMLFLKAKELWHIVVNDKPSPTIKEEDRKGKKKNLVLLRMQRIGIKRMHKPW